MDIFKAYILRSPSQGLLTLNAIHWSVADELSDKAHGNSPITNLAFQHFFYFLGAGIRLRKGQLLSEWGIRCDPHGAVQACEFFGFFF